MDYGRTPEGRPLVPVDGGFATEYTTTLRHPQLNQNQWTNIPTVYGGKFVPDVEALKRILATGGYDPETGRRLQGYRSLPAAELAARQRTQELDAQLRNRLLALLHLQQLLMWQQHGGQ